MPTIKSGIGEHSFFPRKIPETPEEIADWEANAVAQQAGLVKDAMTIITKNNDDEPNI